jgi:RNA polymerase sigma-70 factor (ECF subfamily)
VARTRDGLYRYLRSLVRSDEAAEDALQDVFVGAWRGAGAFRGESGGRVWLFGLARRHAARTWRRRAGEPVETMSLADLGKAAGFGDPDPERLASAVEDQQRLRRALDALSDADREVITLRDLEGLTGPEVAELLELDLAAVKTRLHRARLRLMARLREEDPDAH